MPSILAKRTLSDHPDDHFISKHQKTLSTLADEYAWDYEPQELLEAAMANFTSRAYSHYKITIKKYGSKSHKRFSRAQLNTGAGTTVLLHGADDCDEARGVLATNKKANLVKEYSPAYHRGLLSLWGACSHRSFDSLTNKFHQAKVELLRPGTKLPSSVTLSWDIKLIHTQYIPKVWEYFKSIPGAIHFAIDGWTSPTSESYLGVIVIWYAKAHTHRCILEFIRLTSAHTGAYLAEKIASCLQRYGLENCILAACLDNASNNLTLVQNLGHQSDGKGIHVPVHSSESTYAKALEQFSALHSLLPTAQELRDAQAIMTTVSNLARRVDESPTLKSKFRKYLCACPELKESTRHSLSRCVATRWNSDRKTLDDYLYLWRPVKMLTNDPGLNLNHFALDTTQRRLAEELNKALEVFELPTQHFSSGSVPLVHQVLPALVELKDALTAMCDSSDISPVTRVGAQAALNVYNKYMENLSICEVYYISLAMCPDVKLSWFYQHYDAPSVEAIRQMILARFCISYPPSNDPITSSSQSPEPTSKVREIGGFKAILLRLVLALPPRPLPHSTRTRLRLICPPVWSPSLHMEGHGVLVEQTRLEPAPGSYGIGLSDRTRSTSVDAERAFSAGRLTINHLQHNMSSETFEAKMAVGSWYGTPLLPEISDVAAIIRESM
ncbi:hypothetical protein RHS01_02406 [Rhizoctonia solani]|uniref:HAT C-terminal dimerisation domain-containing protein n=1 Tax=Rhizoctonia solani TaxID=456999 RepID=A0A8H7IGD0_9AGAM|nr:hypothetical protein RHS01_02406 [Rhizoctonia solani]